jgi:hypothetical protein
MKRSFVGSFAASALAFGVSQACSANDWQVRVGPVIENFKHVETTPLGNVKEDGALYGLSLRLARKIGQFEIEGALSHLTNEVDYQGFAVDPSNGNTFPDSKSSDARITEASIRVARWFLATGDRVGLYGGVGYRRWDRDVENNSTSNGQNLDYAWPFVMLGAKFSLHRSERASLMVDVRVTKPLDPKVDVTVTNRSVPLTLELGSKIGYRVEVPFSYKITQTGGIEVAPFYERIELEKSKPKILTALDPTDPLNGLSILEPDAETETFGLHINWLQEF